MSSWNWTKTMILWYRWPILLIKMQVDCLIQKWFDTHAHAYLHTHAHKYIALFIWTASIFCSPPEENQPIKHDIIKQCMLIGQIYWCKNYWEQLRSGPIGRPLDWLISRICGGCLMGFEFIAWWSVLGHWIGYLDRIDIDLTIFRLNHLNSDFHANYWKLIPQIPLYRAWWSTN